jgi:osmotically-inducible protein OsmY
METRQEEQVMDELEFEPAIDATHIGVAVEKGERAAWSVPGVTRVIDRLRITG